MCRLQLFEFVDDEVECFIPGSAFEAAVAFDERIEQSIGMMNLQIGRHAFRTKASFVDRKIITRLKTDNVVLLNKQIHAALDGAVRTMRGDNAVDHTIRTPT